MAKFGKEKKRVAPPISTASLPDIVFMLLFFFMVATVMRDTELKVKIKVPAATELKKLEKKSLVSFIYVGEPKSTYRKTFGTEPRIQLNDQFAKVTDIKDFITAERSARDEKELNFMTTSLKVDENAKMGIVSDIKIELRKSSALKLNYSAQKREKL